MVGGGGERCHMKHCGLSNKIEQPAFIGHWVFSANRLADKVTFLVVHRGDDDSNSSFVVDSSMTDESNLYTEYAVANWTCVCSCSQRLW